MASDLGCSPGLRPPPSTGPASAALRPGFLFCIWLPRLHLPRAPGQLLLQVSGGARASQRSPGPAGAAPTEAHAPPRVEGLPWQGRCPVRGPQRAWLLLRVRAPAWLGIHPLPSVGNREGGASAVLGADRGALLQDPPPHSGRKPSCLYQGSSPRPLRAHGALRGSCTPGRSSSAPPSTSAARDLMWWWTEASPAPRSSCHPLLSSWRCGCLSNDHGKACNPQSTS